VLLNIENKNKKIIEIYPNPTKGELNIDLSSKLNEGLSVKVINASGQIVYIKRYFKDHENIEKLDLSILSEGIYHILIEGIDFKNSKTVIIEK